MKEKVYFFKEKKYIQCDVSKKTIDPGYPREIAQDWHGLPDGFAENIDAATYLKRNDCVYFIKGNKYAVYSVQQDKTVDHGPISSLFNNLDPSFADGIDALIMAEGTLFILYKGKSCVECRFPAMACGAPMPITDQDHYLNSDFINGDWDATLHCSAGTSLYKGSNAGLYESYYGTTTKPISAVWDGTDKVGFDSAIRAAFALPSEKAISPKTKGPDHGNGGDCHNMQVGTVDLHGPGASTTKGGDMDRFTQVNFPKPFPDGSKVVVVPMTQTFNGPDTPGLRIAHVTTTGFKIRINELVASPHGKENQPLSDGTHEKETIGWVAFTADK